MIRQYQLVEQIFAGNSEMAMLMRSHNWSQTPLGAVETWPQSLRTIVALVLNSSFPMVIWWGKELVLLYNDAWQPILGTKHPKALGRPGQEVWSEIWDIIGVQLESVLETAQATWSEDMLLLVDRYGYTEEAFFTYSYSPIFLETGKVGGAFTAVTETTRRVIGERRLRTLRELAATTLEAKSVEEISRIACATVTNNPYDIPFALLYLVQQDGQQARLVGTVRIDAGTPPGPELVDLATEGDCWKFTQVKKTGDAEIIDELITRFGMLSGGAWDEPSKQAIVLPIAMAGQKQLLAGFLVLGISPRRAFDDEYRGFFDLLASNIATAIANAQAYEVERKRAEALAELDRAKTTFFSNVSHEFRTPLTLMLAPLEDTIANLNGTIPPQQREQLLLVQRNGMRLLKLVNSLLDFSRLEAGRVQAAYEPIDLATYTAELASTFRSLIERVGMSLIVDCPTLPEAIYVDREMWEKIVINLLSNAFKFTLAGTITVRLQYVENCVELSVADTGVGIPSEELPDLFERFHQIKNSQGRSFEGSGIGLSLVQELVKIHGGAINVTSTFGQGSCFTVTIPTATAHLPPEQIAVSCPLASTALGAMPYIKEAQGWLPEGDFRLEEWSMAPSTHELVNQPAQSKIQNLKSKILLADDNADMRDYIRRLLSGSYIVQTVADGVAALTAIEKNPPDLVLTDVMMPGMDGFELLRSLRSNPATQDISIILLSARAGEESRIEGLAAGADDYLIKPFSARELLARVEASLKLARLRREATVRERTILGRVTDAFMAMDLDFRLTYANEAAQRVSRTPLEAMLGKTMWEAFPGSIGNQFEFQYRRSLSEQIAVDFEEYYAPFDVWVEVHVYPSPTGLSLFFRDINDRKRMEAALRQSEERYRTLFESIDEGFSVIEMLFDENDTPIDYRFLEINPVFEQQTGLQQAVGKTARQLVPDIEDDWIKIYGQVALTGEPVRFENGSEVMKRWFDVYACRTGQPEARKVAIVFKDISDRKRIEATLRASEQRFRDMADNAPMMIWVTDPTGYCTYLSQNWYEFTGQTEETGLGLGWLDATHPDDHQYAERTFLEANERKTVFRLEYRLRGKDGKYIWAIDAASPWFGTNGEFKGYIGSVIDINDRKQAEKDLLERSRLSALSADIGSILIQHDTLPDTLEQCTEALVRHLDAAFARIWTLNQDKNVLELQASAGMYTHLNGSHRQVPIGQFKIGLIAQERQPHLTNNVIGDPRVHDQQWAAREGIVAFAGYPLIVENQLVGVMALFSRHWLSEITMQGIASVADALSLGIQSKQVTVEREQLLAQEQAAREAAETANRIKDEFLAVLSHELRSPLNPILGWSKLLQQNKLGPAKTASALASIERNALLQSQLIDDLLDISRILSGKLRLNAMSVDLNMVISAALETVRLAASAKSLQIQTTFSPGIGMVIGDSGRLQQVIWNLLSNAVKFTPQGGKISVRLTQTGTYAQILVTDTGKGINPEFLPYVFENFRQEDGAITRKFGGLGLGLAIARQIVELHGGKIWVESRGEGQG
ncbi:ATP-binding protein, partial [Microcoleus sp.]|uniref:ATP-binding protein n=1 Tax=Microcoleus sp. TaxID=44472 RepID=UPI00403EE0CF